MWEIGRPGVRLWRALFDVNICKSPPCGRGGIAYHIERPTLSDVRAHGKLRKEGDLRDLKVWVNLRLWGCWAGGDGRWLVERGEKRAG